MRNLQKILALALALIMSFSLVVTANAAFSDEADITDTYNEAVNVLSQLEVFKGYTDGTYQPQKSITRAEVAAIIYRIATGDVTDTQVSIYSDWNRFTDVHAGEWWAGYINYCANAEYIKGYGNGKFGPDDPVTGYEALAMILRAVGYGKMDGEFQGSDWAVQTAARANTLKVTKNVQNSALLNSAATRELVAELLFRSILVPTVEYNQFSGYSENDTTLGYQSFKLEAIEGVVVANEYANLYDIQVLDAGKTDFEVAKDDVRSLNIGSEITAIGEAHYAYVSGSTVYALENTGDNTVWEPENGKGTKVSDGLKAASLKKNDDTEYYINFGREGHFSCDQRLEFQVTFFHVDAIDSFPFDISKYAYDQNGDDVDTNDWTVEYVKLDANGNEIFSTNKVSENADKSDYVFVGGILKNDPDNKDLITGYEGTRFNRIIRAGQEITNEEMEIIQGIFAVADNEVGNGQPRDQVTGDVFVGTKSTNSATDEERDVSNTMSFRKFKDEYINSEAWDQDVDKSDNGEWLKIVDNDGDGVAEYVFLTEYTLDKAVSSYTKSGETVLEFNSMDIEYIKDNDGIVDYKDEIAVGDVVYYTEIDNRFTITKAPVVKATIKTVNFKDESCTTTEDATYTESGIENKSHLDQEVENLDDKVEYNLYFDAYGWLRAYELANGNTYGLITELYKTTTKNDQYVKGEDLTVELKKGSAKIDEFDVDNSKGNVFLLSAKDKDNGADIDTWDQLRADLEYEYFTTGARILLQPAIGQLGQWNVNRMVDTNIFHQGEKNEDNVAPSYATTNVAVYTETEDGEVRLTSPVKLSKNVKGEQMYYTNPELQGEKDTTDRGYDQRAYEVDYIALDLSDKGVTADMRHYPIHEDSRYANQSRYNNYVDAVHDTQFYVVNVEDKKADYFTDYEKVYAIGTENILAAYAVARNTETDYAKNDYWVADVIVIEVSGVPTTFDSVGLLYNNPSQTSGSVKRVESYNSESENPRIDMILDNGDFDWAPRYNGSWVYEIDEDKIEDGDLYANDLDEITENYNAKGIYAGIVSRIKAVNTRGGYIDVLIPGSDYVYPTRDADDYVHAKTDSISVTDDELFAITSKNGADDIQTNTRSLRMTEGAKDDRLEEEHRVLWVEDKDGHVAFVIDVDFVDDSQKTPHWLGGDTAASLWFAVAKEQVDKQNAVTFDDALKAYNDWVKNPTNETLKKAAISAVKAALENNPTASQKEHLDEMLKNLGGSTTGSSDLVEAWNTYVGDKTAANKAALYKLALEGTYNYSGTSDADKAFKAAVDTAVADLTAFTNAANGKKLAKVVEAKGLVPDANAKALAAKNSGNNTAISNYDKAVTLQAENEKLYDKAEALVLAYNEKDKIGSATTEAMLKAFKAISGPEHDKISDATNRFTDSGYQQTGTGNSHLFGVTNGADYATAWIYINDLYQEETAVGTIETINLEKGLAEKYGATMEKLNSSSTDKATYLISMTDRNGMPDVGAANDNHKNDIVELTSWLGLTLEDATDKEIDGETITLYRLSGNGFVGDGLTRVYVDYIGKTDSYGLILTAYGSDKIADYTVRVAFKYTGSTTPDSYEYTAVAENETGGTVKVTISKVGGKFTANTEVTKVEFVAAPRFDTEDASVVCTRESADFETFTTPDIVVKSVDLGDEGVQAGENVYALVYVAGVDKPIQTGTIRFADKT